MIVKKRGKPLELFRLEALSRRLHPQHGVKEKVLADLMRRRTGIRGEKEIDFPLSFLNEQDYLILQHLRLPDQNGFFQMDNLILSERYILILEVKNWYGTVIYGENGQVTRIGDNGIEEGFPNPVPQAKLQQHRLQKWLYSYGVSNILIDFLVVISFPSTIIKSASEELPIPDQVIHNNQLFFEIQKLNDIYRKPILKMSQLMKLAQQLNEAHTPSSKNILEKYVIELGELTNGVFCPNCSAVPMIRKKQKWYCRTCHQTCKNAHLPTLNDYKWLIGDYISNREARDFLRIDSPYVAKHLLQKEDFKSVGRTSGRMYKFEFR